MDKPVLLEVRDLKTYFYSSGKRALKAVDGVSFSIREGEVFGLVGESGSGKSITCKSLIGLIHRPGRIAGGSIRYRGQELVGLSEKALTAVRGKEIGMIFQEPMVALNPVLRIGQQITESFKDPGLSGEEKHARAVELLRQGQAGCELCAAIAAMTQLLCCVCGMATGSTRATPYAAAGALLILACQWGLYLEAETRRSAYHLLVLNGAVPYVVSATETGVCRQRGTEEGFYRLMSRPDPARYWQNYAMPLVMAVAAVLSGVVCFSDGNMSDFPWVLTALTTAGAGLSIPLSGVLPLYYLSRRLGRSGCAAAGYAGARAVSRSRRLILTDDDLFPPGTVTLNGYKVFGEERSRAVSYAASVAKAAGSSLTPLLERQLTAEGGFHLPVDGLRFCEEGGVEATIRGETVLLGSAYFMKKRKVALPRDMKLPTGVFLAVDGVLTAVFAIKYQPSRNAEWALRTLRRFRITPVLAVRGGNVTPGLIKRKFGVDAKPVYPDVSTRLALAELARQQGETPYAVICREGLLPLVEAVAGSRRAVKAVRTATLLSYLGALAGVALAYYLTSIGNFALLTPLAMVLYQLLWLLPTLLLAGLVKHY